MCPAQTPSTAAASAAAPLHLRPSPSLEWCAMPGRPRIVAAADAACGPCLPQRRAAGATCRRWGPGRNWVVKRAEMHSQTLTDSESNAPPSTSGEIGRLGVRAPPPPPPTTTTKGVGLGLGVRLTMDVSERVGMGRVRVRMRVRLDVGVLLTPLPIPTLNTTSTPIRIPQLYFHPRAPTLFPRPL